MIPCKDCITLPICQLKFHNNINNLDRSYSAYDLCMKCSLITDYINNEDINPKNSMILLSMLDPIVEFYSDKGVL